MLNYSRFTIPIIFLLIIGGILSFLLAYDFNPEKHENVYIDGKCYELLDKSHEEYAELSARKEIERLKQQLGKVESDHAILPIIFSGKDSEIVNFTNKFHFNIISQQEVKYYPNIDASVIIANISMKELENIVGNLTLYDVYMSSKTVAGSIGIEPNTYISKDEVQQISNELEGFMNNGIRKIVSAGDGVKSAECRNIKYIHQK